MAEDTQVLVKQCGVWNAPPAKRCDHVGYARWCKRRRTTVVGLPYPCQWYQPADGTPPAPPAGDSGQQNLL